MVPILLGQSYRWAAWPKDTETILQYALPRSINRETRQPETREEMHDRHCSMLLAAGLEKEEAIKLIDATEKRKKAIDITPILQSLKNLRAGAPSFKTLV